MAGQTRRTESRSWNTTSQ